jgi:hypothetical protein
MQRSVIGGSGNFPRLSPLFYRQIFLKCENDAESQAVLKEAFKVFAGAKFESLLVSTQVVSGVKYLYEGHLQGVQTGNELKPAFVEISKPLEGPAHIVDIKDVTKI